MSTGGIRLGVIGHGDRISDVINRYFRAVEPDLQVVGIVDPDEKGARSRLADCDRENAAFYPTLDDLVRKGRPDALAIGTRCNLHAPYAIEAARCNLPLYLEKPVGISMDQAVALEHAFENSRCQVVVSFALRVSPLCTMMRDCIERDVIGPPVHVHAVNDIPYGTSYWEQFYRDYGISGGLLLKMATHDFDYLMFLMGSPIVRVAAMGTFHHVFGGTKKAGLRCSECDEQDQCLESPIHRFRNGLAESLQDHRCLYSVDCGSRETGTNEDCSSALFEFASGAHGVYSQVFYTRRDAEARGATVSGYGGTLKFDWYTNEMSCVRHHARFGAVERVSPERSDFGGDIELAHDFINVIKGNCRSRTPIQTGLQSVYACLAARESAREGRMVQVRQVGS